MASSDVEAGSTAPLPPIADVGAAIVKGSEEEVSALLAAHPVVVFSKSVCPFAFELKRTLGA